MGRLGRERVRVRASTAAHVPRPLTPTCGPWRTATASMCPTPASGMERWCGPVWIGGVDRWRGSVAVRLWRAHVGKWNAFGARIVRYSGPRLGQGLRGRELVREDLRELLVVCLTTHGTVATDLTLDSWRVLWQLYCHARAMAARQWSVDRTVPQSRSRDEEEHGAPELHAGPPDCKLSIKNGVATCGLIPLT